MKITKSVAVLCSALVIVSSAAAFAPNTLAASNSKAAVTETAKYESKYKLSNPNADELTQKTYDYICDNFGEYILSCQQESTWMGSPDYEMNYIQNNTGKLPAMRGLDFMNGDFNGVVERAKAWHEKGGLVTICWHTGVNGYGYTESLNDNPDFTKILTEGTSEYNAMIANWDKAAEALKKLQDAGVPVLWRPFHEFDGQWFWWGKGGAENFKKLWQMMYDRFTNKFGLTNLIWVLGYADDVKNGWYPGDEYCDIIGSDTYKSNRLTNKYAWDRLQNVTDANKPMAFHECGTLPTIADFEKDGCIWSWFMVWHTTHITGNNKANLSEVYNSERVITLDELPDLNLYYSQDIESKPDTNSSSEAENVNSSSENNSDSSNADPQNSSVSETSSDTSSENSTALTDSSNAENKLTSTSSAATSDNKTNDKSPNTGIKTGLSLLALLSAGFVIVKKKQK